MHETKKEFFEQVSVLGKILYLSGCLKLHENGYELDGRKMYGVKVRRIHVFSWIYMLWVLSVEGFNRKTLGLIKERSEWI